MYQCVFVGAIPNTMKIDSDNKKNVKENLKCMLYLNCKSIEKSILKIIVRGIVIKKLKSHCKNKYKRHCKNIENRKLC